MGVCGNSELTSRSRAIERQLRKDALLANREMKLLLLGTGESGKSTVIKQMRVIYGDGFTDADRLPFRILVWRNCLRSIKAMLDHADKISMPLVDQSLQDPSYDIMDTLDTTYNEIAPHAELFKKLWADETIQAVYARANEYQLSDSTKYYLDDLDRLIEPDYLPTVQDVLRAREPTTGIHEYVFKLGPNAVFRMLDVGGQRSERRKWIHCFENVTSIIFIAASSEFDQKLVEDEETNRMVESVALFVQIIEYYWFKNSSIILFLNKQDLLQEKLEVRGRRFKDFFPDFPLDESPFDTVKDYIKNMYIDKKPPRRDVYTHFTMATDRDNLQKVFDAVKSTILRGHLADYNLLV